MGILKPVKTIPELFTLLTRDFSGASEKPMLKSKVDGEYRDISYKEFGEITEEFAMGLSSMGVKREDKVALISENRPEWVYSDFAITGIGAINVPLYPILTADNIEFILQNSESKCIVVSNKYQLNKVLKIRDKCKNLRFVVIMNEKDKSNDENVYSFSEIQEKGKTFGKSNRNFFPGQCELARPDDLCTIIYTSGTTGEPKGVMLTHWNIMSNVQGAHEALPITKDDLFLSFLPLCHIFERTAGYYTALSAGATIAYAEGIEKIATNMLEIKPTVMTAVPRLFERMYSRIKKNVESQSPKKQKIFNWGVGIGEEMTKYRRSHENPPIGLTVKYKLADTLVFKKLKARTGGRIRFIIVGGAAFPRELGEFFESVGLIVIQGYGLTESSPVLAVNRIDDFKHGTVGKSFPGVELKIAQDGEILAHGPNIMQGYYKNKKETESVLKDGWLHTGDIGVFDPEGFLIITDRKKHLFKTSGGKYIAPAPLENMFLASKYIEQFVLIGDRRMFLSALIVPDFEALREYADAHRISYKDEVDLVELKQIYELLQKELQLLQKQLPSFEKVRKFALLDKPFSIENGELTPKLSLKRKVIEERYGNLINDMYNQG